MSRGAMGAMLERARLYATDEHGKAFPRPASDSLVMHVRETKPHALSHTHGLEEAEGQRLREAAAQRIVETLLTTRERAVHELQRQAIWCEREESFSAEEFERYGYAVDPDVLGVEVLKGGRRKVRRRYLRQLNQSDIAERLGLTPRQVRTAIQGKNHKLKGA